MIRNNGGDGHNLCLRLCVYVTHAQEEPEEIYSQKKQSRATTCPLKKIKYYINLLWIRGHPKRVDANWNVGNIDLFFIYFIENAKKKKMWTGRKKEKKKKRKKKLKR